MHKKKVKNFISCVVFLLLTAVIFVMLTYVFRPMKKNGRRIITNFYNEKRDSLDVVALGASGTYRFFDPMVAWEEQGITSYTYAAASMQASCYITGLKDIYRTQHPDLVIVDARRFSTRDLVTEITPRYQIYMDGPDVTLGRFQGVYYFSRLHDIPLNEAVISYLDLIQYHDNYYALWDPAHLKYFLNRKKTSSSSYKGFLMAHGIEEMEEFTGPAEAGDQEAELGEKVLEIYTDFLDYCKKQGINILLTVSPCDYPADSMMEFNSFARIAEAYGYPFLNANTHEAYEAMGIDFSTDFYNHTHMNVSGAEKYTRYVMDYISSHYDLPDHRGEAAYASWDELLAYYHERADRAYELIDYYKEHGEFPRNAVELESEMEDDNESSFS